MKHFFHTVKAVQIPTEGRTQLDVSHMHPSAHAHVCTGIDTAHRVLTCVVVLRLSVPGVLVRWHLRLSSPDSHLFGGQRTTTGGRYTVQAGWSCNTCTHKVHSNCHMYIYRGLRKNKFANEKSILSTTLCNEIHTGSTVYTWCLTKVHATSSASLMKHTSYLPALLSSLQLIRHTSRVWLTWPRAMQISADAQTSWQDA